MSDNSSDTSTADAAQQPVGQNLTKAQLKIYNPPLGLFMILGDEIATLQLQFNPEQLQISASADWNSTVASKFAFLKIPQFQGAQGKSLTFTVFLDTTLFPDQNTVMQQADLLLSCTQVVMLSYLDLRPSTPWVTFEWGEFETVKFIGYVQSISIEFMPFTGSGIPTRAKCDLTINEIPIPILGQNPTSGALDVHRVHRVAQGDTLQALAWREYGDATKWRAIAEANDIDDPMRLTVGRELLIPTSPDGRN
jgi:nucleoid-associated protein YgaU